MKKSVLLSAVMGAALIRPALADDLTISSSTSSPVATSTASGGTPGNITIQSAGSVSITAAGAAVTLDSNNSVTNAGKISNATGNNGTGVSIVAGNFTGSFTNSGSIEVTGTASSATSQSGILLAGNGSFTGNLTTANGSSVTVSGLNAQAIAIRAPLAGNLTLGGNIQGIGTDANGVRTIAPISGAFINTGNISSNGGGTSTQFINPAPDSGVAIGGNISGGFLNDGPAGNVSTPVATISTSGPSAALMIAPTVNTNSKSITFGTLATDPGSSFVNRGNISSIGKQPAVPSTAIQIGNSGGDSSGLTTIFLGNFTNSGSIISQGHSNNDNATNVPPIATGAVGMVIGVGAQIPSLNNEATGTIAASTTGPAGGTVTTISILPGASLHTLVNDGTISAAGVTSDPTATTLSATAIRDVSGSLTTIINHGTISATATPLTNSSQTTIAATLASTVNAIDFENTGTVLGDIVFGSSPNSKLVIEGNHASVNGQILTNAGGRVRLDISAGGTGGTLTTTGAVRASTLTVGSGGTLDMGIGAGSNGISASGNASFAANSHLIVRPVGLLPTSANITLIHSDTSLHFDDFGNTTSGIQIPFLFNGNVSYDNSKNLTLSLQRKTATELGLSGNTATIFEPAMAAASQDGELGTALSVLGSEADVQASVHQMLPILNTVSKSMAESITDPATNAVGLRQQTLALAPQASGGTEVWAGGIYNRLSMSGADGFTGSGVGVTGGIEYGQPDKGHFGIAFTAYHGEAKQDDSRTISTSTHWVLVTPYLGLRDGPFFFDAQVNAGIGRVNNVRTVQAGSVTRMPTSKATEWLASGGITAGYIVDTGSIRIVPQVNVNVFDLATSNYTEQSGGTGVNLAMDSRNITTMRAYAGVAAGGAYSMYGGYLIPQAFGGYSAEIISDSNNVEGAFAAVPNSHFTLPGPSDDRSGLNGAGSVQYTKDFWTLGISYDAFMASKSNVQSALFRVSGRF